MEAAVGLSLLLLVLQLSLDGRLQLVWRCSACPPLFDLSIFSDEELFKIPLDSLQSHDTWLALFHPLPHRLGFVAVHVRLAQHRKGNAVVQLTEALDVIIAAWVLVAKLVAREADDLKVRVDWLELCMRQSAAVPDPCYRDTGAQTFVELLQSLELRREAALGGRVDDEHHFSLKVGQRVLVALLVFWLEVVEGGCGGHFGEGRLLSLRHVLGRERK